MHPERISRRAQLCILLVLLFALGTLLFSVSSYLDFYAGYPLGDLEEAQTEPALNRFLSESLFPDLGREFDVQIVKTAKTNGCTAVLFSDTRGGAFCGAAELERGSFGRYRIVHIQAGAAPGTVQAFSSWKNDLGIVYGLDCVPTAGSYAITGDGGKTVPMPEERTFIRIEPLSGAHLKLEVFDRTGEKITDEVSGNQGTELPLREYTIGNPKFFTRYILTNIAYGAVFCAIACLVVWRTLRSVPKAGGKRSH